MSDFVTPPPAVDIPRDRWGRPMIKQADGTTLPYTRASTVGKAIEDTYHLGRWQQRQVLRGALAASSSGLLLRVEALGQEPGDDEAHKAWKAALDELVDEAHAAAGSYGRAGLGTYLHTVFEAIDLGRPLPEIPKEYADHYTEARRDRDAKARALATDGWRWLCRELFVVNDTWQVAGTLDGLLLVPHPTRAGRWLIRCGDDKTGKSMDFAGLGYCAQVAVYADALIYDPATGERTTFHSLLPEDIDPAAVDLDTETAVIVHTALGEGRCDIYDVPLAEGRAAVAMATDVRAMRTAARKWLKLVARHEAPTPEAESTRNASAPNVTTPVDRISDLIAAATSVAELMAIREKHLEPVDYGKPGPGGVHVPRLHVHWTDDHEALAAARAAILKPPSPQPAADPVLAEIARAASVPELRGVWTVHKDAWTPERDAAAVARAADLKAQVA